MNKHYWVVIHTPVNKKNIVCGPFENGLDAIALISEDFNYSTTSVHETLEDALANDSKMEFVPA